MRALSPLSLLNHLQEAWKSESRDAIEAMVQQNDEATSGEPEHSTRRPS